MDEHVADIRAHEPAQSGKYIALYDGQCEICQACVSWLNALDGNKKTSPVPISAEAISNLDARLNLEDCLRQLHVLTPDRELHVGWDAAGNASVQLRQTPLGEGDADYRDREGTSFDIA